MEKFVIEKKINRIKSYKKIKNKKDKKQMDQLFYLYHHLTRHMIQQKIEFVYTFFQKYDKIENTKRIKQLKKHILNKKKESGGKNENRENNQNRRIIRNSSRKS